VAPLVAAVQVNPTLTQAQKDAQIAALYKTSEAIVKDPTASPKLIALATKPPLVASTVSTDDFWTTNATQIKWIFGIGVVGFIGWALWKQHKH
jgi:hypothetical protein